MNMQLDDRLLESTWQEIEFEIKNSEEIGPLPGFTNRWKVRLAEQRKAVQRRQAWLFIIINTIAAIFILGIIVAMNFPASSNMSEAFVGIMAIFSKALVQLKMLAGIIDSILRNIPKFVPSTSWMSIAMSFATLFIFWISTIRKVVGQRGNTK